MILIRRIVADIRGPDQGESDVDMIVNEKLIDLQSDSLGSVRKDIKVVDIKETTRDSGIQNFMVIYDDKSLNIKSSE